MENDHPALEYCRNDLETFRNRLAALKNDSLKVGRSIDGLAWTNIRSEEIAHCEENSGNHHRHVNNRRNPKLAHGEFPPPISYS